MSCHIPSTQDINQILILPNAAVQGKAGVSIKQRSPPDGCRVIATTVSGTPKGHGMPRIKAIGPMEGAKGILSGECTQRALQCCARFAHALRAT